MLPINILGEFVKFTRGTPEEYENLPKKNGNTLYFISEPNATSGKLYLGEKLIDGNLDAAMNLSDLQDVSITKPIEFNSLLSYNGLRWIPKALDELINELHLPILIGATQEENGKEGLVPAPQKEDVSKFLCGDGSWKST